jgi:hypothetical protein
MLAGVLYFVLSAFLAIHINFVIASIFLSRLTLLGSRYA